MLAKNRNNPLSERLLLKLSPAMLEQIDQRLGGESRAVAIRTALREWIARTPVDPEIQAAIDAAAKEAERAKEAAKYAELKSEFD